MLSEYLLLSANLSQHLRTKAHSIGDLENAKARVGRYKSTSESVLVVSRFKSSQDTGLSYLVLYHKQKQKVAASKLISSG